MNVHQHGGQAEDGNHLCRCDKGEGGGYDLVAALQSEGDVKKNKFFTIFKNDEADFKLFPDGRAIINGVPSGDDARKIFAKYIDR